MHVPQSFAINAAVFFAKVKSADQFANEQDVDPIFDDFWF